MKSNLRPMTLREILDRSFSVYRTKFLVFAGIAALPALAYMTLSTIQRIFQLNHTNSGKFLLFHMTLSGLSSKAEMYFIDEIIHLMVYPAFAFVTVSAITGQPSSFRSAFTFSRNRIREFLSLALALATVEIVVPALLFVGSAGLIGRIVANKADGPIAGGAELIFVLIVVVIVGFVVKIGTSLTFSFPVSALESVPWLESLKRSWMLSRGCRIRIFLTWLLIFVVGMGLMMLVILPADGLIFALNLKHVALLGYPLYRLLNSFGIAAVSTLFGPLFPIAVTLFYYDQRMRREGYDIERMMQSEWLPAVSPPAPMKPSASVNEPPQAEDRIGQGSLPVVEETP
jgi:hypothetical protein